MFMKKTIENFKYLKTFHTSFKQGILTKRHTQNIIQPKKHTKKIVFGTIISSFIAYDAIQNDFAYSKAIERFLRSTKITIIILADYVWTLKGLDDKDPTYKQKLSQVNQRAADRILLGCLQNGGIYIKLGQGVAGINHILPEEYTETLKQLYNKCLPRKRDEVVTLMLQDFGKTPEEIFKTFDYKPIAAASLAQVFKAETKSGEKVAVKIQYIDLQKRFKTDIKTILFLQDCVGLLFKNYNFGWILEDLSGNLMQELDFIHEGKNLEKCGNHLKKFDYATVPKVYWDLSTTRVLTAEFIDGYIITDVECIKKAKLDFKDIDIKLFNIFAEQIFNTGFVHADPHPGNVFVRKDKSGKSEIILLDHGLYEYIEFELRQNLCQFWKALVLKDRNEMKKYGDKLGVSDSIQFAEMLLQRPFEFKGAKFATKLSDEELAYMTQMAKNRFDLIMNTLKEMPRNLIFVIRNLNTVRGIAREHGDPCDRPKLMARYALKCIVENRRGIFGYISWLKNRLIFEYKLWKDSTKFWILTSYLKLITKLGRSNDTSHLLDITIKV